MDQQINNMLRSMRRGNETYRQSFKCYPSVFADISNQKSEKIRKGGKILMPPSSLDLLMRYNVEFPMMFKRRQLFKVHCGVLEFISGEGTVFVPQWMMDNLDISAGEEITLENVT